MVWVFRPAAYKDVGTIFVHTNPQLPSDFVIPTRSSVPSCSKPSKDEAFGGAQTRAILDRFCARRALVSIFPSKFRDWQIVHGAVRKNPEIAADMLAFMRVHGVKSVAMSDGLMACPHQEGIDYEGEWCPDPACAFWHGRDRFTHKLVQ